MANPLRDRRRTERTERRWKTAPIFVFYKSACCP